MPDDGCFRSWTLDLSRRKQRRKKFKFRWIVDKESKGKAQPVLGQIGLPTYVPRKMTWQHSFIPGTGFQLSIGTREVHRDDDDKATNEQNHADLPTHPDGDGRSRKQRQEELWQKARPDLLRHVSAQETRRKERTEARRKSERDLFVQDVACKSTPCPECGCQFTDTDNKDEVVSRPPVWVVTFDFCHKIEMPVFECTRCSTQDGKQMKFNLHPIELGAFPSTPVKLNALYPNKSSHRIVLYSIELLELLRDAVDACPKLDITSFTRLLCRRISKNRCELPISEDYLRKKLGTALKEFSRLGDDALNE